MTQVPHVALQPSPWGDETPSRIVGFPRLRRLLWFVIPAGMLLFIVLGTVTGYLVKWLWMRELDYGGIFWTLLSIKWTMFGAAFIFSFLYLWLNARWAVKNGAVADQARVVTSLAALVSAGIAVFVALAFSSQWDTWLRFRYGGAFGQADPLFGVDVGFYVFHLPFYKLLQTGVMLLTVVALVSAVFIYVLFGALRTNAGGKPEATGKATSHISVLLLILVANWGVGLYLDHYDLVYSTLGVVYGAGYAADHVTRLALWFMVAVSVVSVVALAVNVFRPRIRWLLAGAGVYVTLYVVAVFVLPALFQRFIVQPSELALETPYLKHYIASTRAAYRLDAIKEVAYPAMADLTAAAVARIRTRCRTSACGTLGRCCRPTSRPRQSGFTMISTMSPSIATI